MSSDIVNIDKEKVNKAYNIVESVLQNKELSVKFKSHIKNIPMYIFNNGLIATVIFIKKKAGKGEKIEEKSYTKIKDMLLEYYNEELNEGEEIELEDLIPRLIQLDSKEYRYCTIAFLSYLEWVKKFSESLIEDTQEDDSNEQ